MKSSIFAWKKTVLGFQVFNAVNDTITADLPTAEFLAKYALTRR